MSTLFILPGPLVLGLGGIGWILTVRLSLFLDISLDLNLLHFDFPDVSGSRIKVQGLIT